MNTLEEAPLALLPKIAYYLEESGAGRPKGLNGLFDIKSVMML